ncbi:MAG TPA: hypothetical protein DDX14_07855, partial [Cyanobacteria bacterium UBA9579]|nr:hypothetical protein [Cyanobacteria bacterium UBA9579]
MRIFIVIYLLITLGLLLFTAGIDNIFSEMQVVFDRYSHISIELLSAIIAFLVFFKANLFGSKTNDRRFIVIGTGFLVTGLFTIYHLLTSEIPPFDKITAYNLNEQIYFLFHRWFAIIAIFVAPFVKPVNSISMGEFKFKLYSAVLIVIVALAILLEVNNRFISPFIIQPESEIILKNSMLLIVLSLYILSTFIYIDKFLFTARRNIHLFLLGLIITGVNHLNLYTETVTPAEDIIYHLIRNIGFFFILLGLNKSIFENKTTYNYVFRSKNAIYYSVFYVGVSLIWIFTTSYLYIPEFTRITIYMLLLYLILVFLGGYRLSQKISLPISNLHTGVDNLFSRLIYKDTESKGNDLELIPVVSSDEIGEITAKINIVVDSYNNVGQEYEKNLAIERLHRDIIDLFSHFKFTEALQKSVNKIGEYFSVDRSSIVLSDGNRIEEGLTGRCSVIEYLRNSTIPVVSISKDIEPYFESFLGFIKDKKILVINDSQKAVFSADIEKFYNLSNTRSHISVVLEYERDFFGILKITQINSTREWTESEVNLINSLAKVLSNELYKQKLFQEIDTRIYRENQLSKIFDIIRKTQDVDKIPELLCREILELFNLDRVVIVQYKPELEERVIIATECRSSNDIPEMHGTSVTKDTKEYFYLQLKENNEIVINNRDEADLPSFVKEDMKRFEAKALMLLPLYKEQDYWGFIDLTQTRYSRIWKEEEIALAKTITSAVYAAVEKAQLYTGLQIKTKKEDITDVFTKELIRTRDLNKLLGVICKEALDIFQVDRITIRSYPVAEDYSQSELLSEYKSQPDIPEEKEMPYLSKITEYYATRLFDEERDIVYENIEESDLPDYFVERQKQIGVKSIIALPISNGENKLGIIILTSTHKYKRWSESEIELLHLIADYLFISIREIKLYSNLQEKVNREKLLRDIIISIRGTFDLEAVKQYIVNAIGQTLDADRCDLHEIGPDVDPNNVTEYLSSQDLKSFKDVSMQDSGIKYWRDINIKAKAEVALYDPEKYIRDHHLEGTPAAKHIEEFKIKTGFGVPILYDSEVLGILIIHFTRKKFYFSEDDLEFVRTLSSQVGIAIYQTRVYSDLKFTAERERILRSISFEMKSVLGIKEIKKTLVENVGKYFNASRSYIVEYDPKTEIPKLVDDFAEWVSPGARSITSVNLSMGLFDQPVFKDARSYFEVHDVDKFIQENDLADYRETFRQANTHSFATVPIIYTDERIGILILSFTYDK